MIEECKQATTRGQEFRKVTGIVKEIKKIHGYLRGLEEERASTRAGGTPGLTAILDCDGGGFGLGVG